MPPLCQRLVSVCRRSPLAVCLFLFIAVTTLPIIVMVFLLADTSQIQSGLSDGVNVLHLSPSSICKELDIALMVASADEAKHAADLIKTILYYRTKPLHLHIFVNTISHPIMSTLLDTWELIEVRFTLYSLPAGQNWTVLPFKLLTLLPTFLQRVLYLDNSLRLLANTETLMTTLNTEDGHQYSLGISFSLSECSNKGVDCSLLPNILLLNRANINQSEFFHNSMLTANTIEDVNLVIKQHEDKVYEIPCRWRVELNRQFDINKCLQGEHISGILWSSKSQTMSQNSDIDKAVESVDAILRSSSSSFWQLQCSKQSTNSSLKSTDPTAYDTCAYYKYLMSLKRRTHLYYLGGGSFTNSTNPPNPGSPDHLGGQSDVVSIDVTLLTQLSIDRLHMLELVLAAWTGPAIVVLHLTDEQAVGLVAKLEGTILYKAAMEGRVVYHVVYKRLGYDAINYLRNVALSSSRTPYIFTLDVDLVPNPGLYESIKLHLASSRGLGLSSKSVLMVPAFEAVVRLDGQIPSDKAALQVLLNKKHVAGYGVKNKWDLGHRPTNYKFWRNANQPYTAKYTDFFEPYVVLPTNDSLRYSENLLERMMDKIMFTNMLHARGYTFRVLPHDFLIHLPHATSLNQRRQADDSTFDRCTTYFVNQYKEYLIKTYSNNTVSSK